MRHVLFLCALAAAAPAMLAPTSAIAQERDTLNVGAKLTLSFPRAMDRIEVDREDVIAVSAPSPRSVRITGLNRGNATLRVYARDGTLMDETQINVLPGEARIPGLSAGDVVAGQKVVAVDVQFAAVSVSTLKALGFNFSKLSGGLQGAVVSPSSLGSFGGSSSALGSSLRSPRRTPSAKNARSRFARVVPMPSMRCQSAARRATSVGQSGADASPIGGGARAASQRSKSA